MGLSVLILKRMKIETDSSIDKSIFLTLTSISNLCYFILALCDVRANVVLSTPLQLYDNFSVLITLQKV